jgi:hypothetical protein
MASGARHKKTPLGRGASEYLPVMYDGGNLLHSKTYSGENENGSRIVISNYNPFRADAPRLH